MLNRDPTGGEFPLGVFVLRLGRNISVKCMQEDGPIW